MSCAGKGYGTNPRSDLYLSSQFYSSFVQNAVTPKSTSNCRKFKGFYPSFTPTLGSLSVNSSAAGSYSLVYVTGSNFLPNGTTFIKFGNYGYLPVTYYSSFNISFVVPLTATVGNVNVQVVNLYNGNFSPPVNQSYSGNLNYSNSLIYTIT
jgi:hypothetical protein